jgi:hypothetical protein
MVATHARAALADGRVALHHHQAEGDQRAGPWWAAKSARMNTDEFWARLSPGTMATRHHTTNMSITSQHVSIVERLATTRHRLVWV